MIHHLIISAAEETANQGVLGTLGINWKLFIAQLINFSIVLFIFWRWVVKPLGKALNERQARIESGVKNADLMEKEKAEFDVWKKEEMQKARVEADRIIKSAAETADKVKAETIAEAHAQAGKLIEQTKASLVQEKDSAMREIRQEVATLVVAASEKILRTKINDKKDQEFITETLKEIK